MRRYAPRYCAMGGVFELQHVDPRACRSGGGSASPDRALANSRDGVRQQSIPSACWRPVRPHQPLGRGAELVAVPALCRLLRTRQSSSSTRAPRPAAPVPQRLVHEDAAAVHRRADRVGRDEQHAQPLGRRLHGGEAVAEIAAQRPPEGLGVADRGEAARAPARAHRAAASCRNARHSAAKVGRPGASPNSTRSAARRAQVNDEVRGQPRPLVDVLPAEQQEVLLQHRLDLVLR